MQAMWTFTDVANKQKHCASYNARLGMLQAMNIPHEPLNFIKVVGYYAVYSRASILDAAENIMYMQTSHRGSAN